MSKGDKFIAITNYLINHGENSITLSFEEIEKILGFELAPSAYTSSAYWYPSDTHTITLGWINAGYVAKNISINKKMITFIKQENSILNSEKKSSVNYLVKTTNTYKTKEIDIVNISLDINELVKKIYTYDNVQKNDNNARYKSWEHCYIYFQKNKSNKEKTDEMALHLAFYLASWGMLRNSFLWLSS
jgi:hypothetical protein